MQTLANSIIPLPLGFAVCDAAVEELEFTPFHFSRSKMIHICCEFSCDNSININIQ